MELVGRLMGIYLAILQAVAISNCQLAVYLKVTRQSLELFDIVLFYPWLASFVPTILSTIHDRGDVVMGVGGGVEPLFEAGADFVAGQGDGASTSSRN